jgi:hypothetical protein
MAAPAECREKRGAQGRLAALLGLGPGLRPKEAERLLRLQLRLARAQRGSNRRHRLKRVIARLRARETDRQPGACDPPGFAREGGAVLERAYRLRRCALEAGVWGAVRRLGVGFQRRASGPDG